LTTAQPVVETRSLAGTIHGCTMLADRIETLLRGIQCGLFGESCIPLERPGHVPDPLADRLLVTEAILQNCFDAAKAMFEKLGTVDDAARDLLNDAAHGVKEDATSR